MFMSCHYNLGTVLFKMYVIVNEQITQTGKFNLCEMHCLLLLE